MDRNKLKAMNDTQRTLEILIESERLADRILQNKQEILALSKRKEDTRMAIRDLNKSNDEKTWITIGSLLIEMKKDKAIDLLEKDQKQISIEINKLRSDDKILITDLRDMEMCSPLKGFDLKPLSKDEISGLRSNLPNF